MPRKVQRKSPDTRELHKQISVTENRVRLCVLVAAEHTTADEQQ